MCIDMYDNIVVKVPTYFKIISMIIFCFTVLICNHYLGIILLFGILLFVTIRSNVNYNIYFISISFILFLFLFCFSLHLHYIYIFKVLLIVYYFRYLMEVNNYYELDSSLVRIFKYKLFKLINRYNLFKGKVKFFIKTNKSIYGKSKIINSIYLGYKESKNNNNNDYVLIKERKTLYSYLFVIMHFVTFIFVFLLEVYR